MHPKKAGNIDVKIKSFNLADHFQTVFNVFCLTTDSHVDSQVCSFFQICLKTFNFEQEQILVCCGAYHISTTPQLH